MTDDRTMQHNSIGGFLIGCVTGMAQFFLQINSAFGERLLEAALTALVSGMAGMLGSWLISLIIKKFRAQHEKVSERK